MREAEQRVAQWLATHHAVVTRSRAVRLGMSVSAIDRRVAAGRWLVLHPGVYTDAASVATPMRDLVAALAAVGPGSMASHLSAAWLLDLVPEPPAALWVLAAPGVHRAPRHTTVVRCRRAAPSTTYRGLPCTSAARTLVDCASVVTGPVLADLVDRSLAGRLVDLVALHESLRPGAGDDRRRGRKVLRVALRERGFVGGPAPSVLESRMARLLARLRLPPVRAEIRWSGGRYRLDFAWVECRMAVEVDGYAWHASPERMRGDQRRRNVFAQAGWTVLVYTWRDVVDDAERVGREIRETYCRCTALATGGLSA